MTARRVVFVGGGARSGKSAFALVRARELGERRAFVATARAYDGEMEDRIARHRAERPDFTTLEEPVALPERIASLSGFDVAVVDCLTLWLSNLLIDGIAPPEIERRVGDLVRALRAAPCHVVLVSNEVGMGVTRRRRSGARSAISPGARTRPSRGPRTSSTSPSSASSCA